MVTLTAYVRRERALVLGAVRSGVGGPGSGVWSGGWHLGVGYGALARVAPEARLFYLISELQEGSSVHAMSQSSREAWMRTWRPTD
jgi:hypothetical protein